VDLSVLVDSAVAPGVRDRLVAGIAITAFVTLEQFVAARSAELALYVSGGLTRLAELDNAARKTLLVRTGKGLNSQMQRRQMSESDRIAAADSVGRALAGIGTGPLRLAPESLTWIGSNLQASDLEEGLQILGCREKPWEALTMVLSRANRQSPSGSIKASFDTLSTTRHRAAHSAAHATSVTVLRSLPRLVFEVGLAWDCLASHLGYEVRKGRLPSVPNSPQRIVKYRFVERSGRSWRHLAEGRIRGTRATTSADAWADATHVAGQNGETLLELAADGSVERWEPVFCP
jgi:hypothetical protein